jgi:hypothetical protein
MKKNNKTSILSKKIVVLKDDDNESKKNSDYKYQNQIEEIQLLKELLKNKDNEIKELKESQKLNNILIVINIIIKNRKQCKRKIKISNIN